MRKGWAWGLAVLLALAVGSEASASWIDGKGRVHVESDQRGVLDYSADKTATAVGIGSLAAVGTIVFGPVLEIGGSSMAIAAGLTHTIVIASIVTGGYLEYTTDCGRKGLERYVGAPGEENQKWETNPTTGWQQLRCQAVGASPKREKNVPADVRGSPTFTVAGKPVKL